MLGTGKVPLVTTSESAYDIIVKLYKISDTNSRTAQLRANQLFARAGANRQVITPGNSIEYANREDILEHISDVSRPYVTRICSIISRLTSPFKRKCAVGFFMANGTSLRYPDEFKLDVGTDDPVKNVENEEINKLIYGFRDELQQRLYNANMNFNAYIEENFPKEVQMDLMTKAGDYWAETTTTNVYRSLEKSFKSRGLPWTKDDESKFKEVFLEYRQAAKSMTEPKYSLVCGYLGIDQKTMIQVARDAIGPIIAAMPDKLLRGLINGE